MERGHDRSIIAADDRIACMMVDAGHDRQPKVGQRVQCWYENSNMPLHGKIGANMRDVYSLHCHQQIIHER